MTDAVGICADGPMAGTEFAVPPGPDGRPADVVDVEGHTYLLALQSPPAGVRPWRYSIVREGTLIGLEGGRGQVQS